MLAALTFLTIMLGAWVTSARSAPPIFLFIEQIHSGAGRAAAVLIVVLAVWLMAAQRRGLGLTLLAAGLAETAFGEFLAPITHAILAQVLFALTTIAAVCTSNGWELGPEIVPAIERFFRPGYVNFLTKDWLGAVPGLLPLPPCVTR